MKSHKQAREMDKQTSPFSLRMRHRLQEGFFLLLVAAAFFLLISLFSYHTNDPGWSSTGLNKKIILNWGGRTGAWVADVFLSLFGLIAYVLPFLIVIANWLKMNERDDKSIAREWIYYGIGWITFTLSACALASFYIYQFDYLPVGAGGIFGDLVGRGVLLLFNHIGGTLILLTLLLSGITLITGLSWFQLIDSLGEFLWDVWENYQNKKRQRLQEKEKKIEVDSKFTLSSVRSEPKLIASAIVPLQKPSNLIPLKVIEPIKEVVKKIEKNPEKSLASPQVKLKVGMLPPLSLLNSPLPSADKPFNQLGFEELSALVEQRLADFGVDIKVVAVHPGPVITRFELDLAPGIKVSKITGLAKDIARSLSVVSVRVVEVIPGKSVIGLEIPNENRDVVSLREMVACERYQQSLSPLSLVLGKDISGHAVVVDLAKMPHLLVAGTTGSGKSVSLNVMLLSMLYKASPEQLRLILIDPKMLELSVYEGIPHLLTPVITDMKDASNALRWCVAEMDKRYRLMAALGVRHLNGYNQKVNDCIKQGQPMLTPTTLVTDEASAKAELMPLPTIVVIIDELADMMMVVGKKVEDLIARIAQKARAAGIHLILATQRPSVDVITGLIKANIPTRIAFQVSSRIDSRTILDQQGAEQLLGHGDMLYLPPGVGVPMRVHGAYVTDEEVHRVVAAWRTYGEPTYLHSVTEEEAPEGEGDSGSEEQDTLYDEAVRIVTDSRRASISLVQRRLRIGYNRAARIMEQMEAAGVVTNVDGNGGREVLANAIDD